MIYYKCILLARYGYQVTIFESKEKIGGILRYGIPEFRLPKSVLDDIEYRHLELKGIKVRPNIRIGDAISLDATARGLLDADERGRTSRPGVFASGDVVVGARTVVEAVAHSKVVAEAMHEYIQNLDEE